MTLLTLLSMNDIANQEQNNGTVLITAVKGL
jgi:hypothetical protein